jgi:hypothetical protein
MRAYQPPFDYEGRVGTPLQASVPPGPRPVLFAEEVGPTERVLVVGDDIFGTPDSGAEAIRRLAAAANCALLEVEIGRTIARGDRVVCNANPFPDRLAATEAEALAATLIQ